MSTKQDKTYTRTASELEQKYSFGKRFAEILGIATDAREGVGKLGSDLAAVEARITKTEDGLRADVVNLSQRVNMTMSADAIKATISEAIEEIDGAFVKSTGYTFDKEGLRIRKNESEMENLLDNTGMYVNKITGGETDNILTANNVGVNTLNLTVRKYFNMVEDSRFEKYTDEKGKARTACYWVGD